MPSPSVWRTRKSRTIASRDARNSPLRPTSHLPTQPKFVLTRAAPEAPRGCSSGGDEVSRRCRRRSTTRRRGRRPRARRRSCRRRGAVVAPGGVAVAGVVAAARAVVAGRRVASPVLSPPLEPSLPRVRSPSPVLFPPDVSSLPRVRSPSPVLLPPPVPSSPRVSSPSPSSPSPSSSSDTSSASACIVLAQLDRLRGRVVVAVARQRGERGPDPAEREHGGEGQHCQSSDGHRYTS